MSDVRLSAGVRGRADARVDAARTAAAMGSGTLCVLATPAMIALMEAAAANSVAPLLEAGATTVGTKLGISHIAATPLGAAVWCESELTAVDGRRLVFRVTAHDAAGVIGEGTHERFIVDADRFMNKANSRK
ncbi:MAG: thioesterase family protein [Oscillospiraceae bacterium]|nr:thioesterase family protein [Oscillospiraceae bacterium]